MSEFKGTQGIWTKNGINGVNSENGRCIALTYQNYGRNNEIEYDALLISKAPDLLEAVKETFNLMDKLQMPSEFEISKLRNKLFKLIKESTEL